MYNSFKPGQVWLDTEGNKATRDCFLGKAWQVAVWYGYSLRPNILLSAAVRLIWNCALQSATF